MTGSLVLLLASAVVSKDGEAKIAPSASLSACRLAAVLPAIFKSRLGTAGFSAMLGGLTGVPARCLLSAKEVVPSYKSFFGLLSHS